MDLTVDTFFDGRIKILQPMCGYRVAMDPLVLSDLIQPLSGQKVLDAGCGVGTIAMIIKYREPTTEVFAIDMDENMCEICRKNAEMNNLKIDIIEDDLEKHNFGINTFDQVVTNPPFYGKSAFRVSRDRELANFETISLRRWIISCLRPLKNGGIFSIIHIAGRINEIINILQNRVGDMQIIPVFTKPKSPAKRVIVTGVKGSRSETRIMPGIVMNKP